MNVIRTQNSERNAGIGHLTPWPWKEKKRLVLYSDCYLPFDFKSEEEYICGCMQVKYKLLTHINLTQCFMLNTIIM